MGRTLALYCIREIALPTLVAVVIITFIFLIHMVHQLIGFVMLPGVKILDVISIMANYLPHLVLFSAPMAVLIGVIIGIGRLSLDREVLAIRAGGVNLLKTLVPFLVLAMFVSLMILRFSGNEIPRLLLAGQVKLSQMQHRLITGLQPGKFHDEQLEKLMGKDSGLAFYFSEWGKREDAPAQMRGIIIRTITDFYPDWISNYIKAREDAKEQIKEGMDAELPNLESYYSPPVKPRDSTTSGVARHQTQFVTTPTLVFKSDQDNLEYLKTHIPLKEIHPYIYRRKESTLIFADRGKIDTVIDDIDGDGEAETIFELILENGSLHRLTSGETNEDYLVMDFKQAKRRLFPATELTKQQRSSTNDQLREIIRAGDQQDEKSWGRARKELLNRYVMAFTFFVFAWIGIPLAIVLPPSGRSWGILMAIALMLTYYLVMQTGLTWFQDAKSGGLLLTLLPNILYFLMGILLWLRTIRS